MGKRNMTMASQPPQPETVSLWGWLFAGMGGAITYILTILRDKIGREQFKEFKESNTLQHLSHSKKLDCIIDKLESKKRRTRKK
jgi:hypothetical protein